MADVSRRLLLKAFPFIGAAAALPVAAAEGNGSRLDSLMQEIAEILDEELMGTFTAIIGPSKEDRPLATLMPTSDVRKAISLLREPAGAVIGPDVAELIVDWNRKQDAATLAWRQFEIDVKGFRSAERRDHPDHERCNLLSLDAEHAMGKMIRALRECEVVA